MQRRHEIGYNRSFKLIDALELDGVIKKVGLNTYEVIGKKSASIETTFDDLDNLDAILNGAEGEAEQNLDSKAEELGMFKSPLHKRAWEALTDAQKQKCVENSQIYDALA